MIESEGHRRPVVLAADLSKRGTAEALAARATEALGAIDVLINNAAVEGVGSYAATPDDDTSRALFEVNYWSPFALSRALLSSMSARGCGAIPGRDHPGGGDRALRFIESRAGDRHRGFALGAARIGHPRAARLSRLRRHADAACVQGAVPPENSVSR
jgi:NAD(P)-dependent dehydrogenase (short-subunit alcohol dehydrogenase family)